MLELCSSCRVKQFHFLSLCRCGVAYIWDNAREGLQDADLEHGEEIHGGEVRGATYHQLAGGRICSWSSYNYHRCVGHSQGGRNGIHVYNQVIRSIAHGCNYINLILKVCVNL